MFEQYEFNYVFDNLNVLNKHFKIDEDVLCEETGLTHSSLSKVKCGGKEGDYIKLIAKYYGVTPQSLIYRNYLLPDGLKELSQIEGRHHIARTVLSEKTLWKLSNKEIPRQSIPRSIISKNVDPIWENDYIANYSTTYNNHYIFMRFTKGTGYVDEDDLKEKYYDDEKYNYYCYAAVLYVYDKKGQIYIIEQNTRRLINKAIELCKEKSIYIPDPEIRASNPITFYGGGAEEAFIRLANSIDEMFDKIYCELDKATSLAITLDYCKKNHIDFFNLSEESQDELIKNNQVELKIKEREYKSLSPQETLDERNQEKFQHSSQIYKKLKKDDKSYDINEHKQMVKLLYETPLTEMYELVKHYIYDNEIDTVGTIRKTIAVVSLYEHLLDANKYEYEIVDKFGLRISEKYHFYKSSVPMMISSVKVLADKMLSDSYTFSKDTAEFPISQSNEYYDFIIANPKEKGSAEKLVENSFFDYTWRKSKKNGELFIKESQTKGVANDEIFHFLYNISNKFVFSVQDVNDEEYIKQVYSCELGDKVHLLREINNRYDSNAITVVREKDNAKLGHVNQAYATILSPLLDSSKIIIEQANICMLRNRNKDGSFTMVPWAKIEIVISER